MRMPARMSHFLPSVAIAGPTASAAPRAECVHAEANQQHTKKGMKRSRVTCRCSSRASLPPHAPCSGGAASITALRTGTVPPAVAGQPSPPGGARRQYEGADDEHDNCTTAQAGTVAIVTTAATAADGCRCLLPPAGRGVDLETQQPCPATKTGPASVAAGARGELTFSCARV